MLRQPRLLGPGQPQMRACAPLHSFKQSQVATRSYGLSTLQGRKRTAGVAVRASSEEEEKKDSSPSWRNSEQVLLLTYAVRYAGVPGSLAALAGYFLPLDALGGFHLSLPDLLVGLAFATPVMIADALLMLPDYSPPQKQKTVKLRVPKALADLSSNGGSEEGALPSPPGLQQLLEAARDSALAIQQTREAAADMAAALKSDKVEGDSSLLERRTREQGVSTAGGSSVQDAPTPASRAVMHSAEERAEAMGSSPADAASLTVKVEAPAADHATSSTDELPATSQHATDSLASTSAAQRTISLLDSLVPDVPAPSRPQYDWAEPSSNGPSTSSPEELSTARVKALRQLSDTVKGLRKVREITFKDGNAGDAAAPDGASVAFVEVEKQYTVRSDQSPLLAALYRLQMSKTLESPGMFLSLPSELTLLFTLHLAEEMLWRAVVLTCVTGWITDRLFEAGMDEVLATTIFATPQVGAIYGVTLCAFLSTIWYVQRQLLPLRLLDLTKGREQNERFVSLLARVEKEIEQQQKFAVFVEAFRNASEWLCFGGAFLCTGNLLASFAASASSDLLFTAYQRVRATEVRSRNAQSLQRLMDLGQAARLVKRAKATGAKDDEAGDAAGGGTAEESQERKVSGQGDAEQSSDTEKADEETK